VVACTTSVRVELPRLIVGHRLRLSAAKMKITFELNPPKIVKDHHFNLVLLNQEIQKFTKRACQLLDLVDGIHLTDSVLGIPRISSVTAAGIIRKIGNHLNLSCSVRVRDRNYTSICQFVSDAILIGVKGVLVLMGDDPADGSRNLGLKPTSVLKMLYYEKFNAAIDFYLTIPAKIKGASCIQKKIDAKPSAFVTQSIASLSDLGEIVDVARLHEIPVVACIMVPSTNNQTSAEMIGLDWKEYQNNAVDFIRDAGDLASEILLTSPNSFRAGLELIETLRKNRPN
jgi:5,10-methylenetetrahydrofolate reductase